VKAHPLPVGSRDKNCIFLIRVEQFLYTKRKAINLRRIFYKKPGQRCFLETVMTEWTANSNLNIIGKSQVFPIDD